MTWLGKIHHARKIIHAEWHDRKKKADYHDEDDDQLRD